MDLPLELAIEQERIEGHARAVGLSFLRPRGMRSPSFGSSEPLSLSRMKLLAGLPGSTRSLPAAAATGLVGGTPTRSPYASVGASESRWGD